LTTITLAALLARANLPPSALIDQLWMDSEGGEYTLLPLVVFANASALVCQMNVELHGPPRFYGLRNDEHFDRFVRDVFGTESKFAVVKASAVAGHHRLATVNVHDDSCWDVLDVADGERRKLYV